MQYLKSAVNATFEKTIPEVVTTILEHAVYPFRVENKIKDLESATRDLVAMKLDVMTSIDIAERQNGSPTQQVMEWLNKVEAIEKEADEIQENNRKRKRSFWSNYTTSSRAVKKLRKVKNLCQRKPTIEVNPHLPPPLAQEMPVSSSKSSNLELALHYIRDDVHSIIGIWGMGGVGKTHLLKQINNELSRDPTFKVVVFITCSKECSEEKVQNEIIDNLRLDKNCKNDTKRQKQNTIYNFLRKRSFVLLLDDLWNRVDLDTIGIPDPMGIVGTLKRKIVLTTRSTEVCGQMEVKKRIRVDSMNWDEAWSLFIEKVTEDTINSDPFIQKFAVNVVMELGGLPLALITVGRAMHDKMDSSEWEQTLKLLKQAHLNDLEFAGTNQSVFHTLRFSYDNLKNDTLRQCFLHCSLWPEDWSIEKNDLVELWMGLGLIDELEIQAAYNVGYSYIRRLQAACLLESVDDHHVQMHDVIRDMALWIANNQGVDSNKWIVQADTDMEHLETKVSHETEKLSAINIGSNISFSTKFTSTKLSTLLLNNNRLRDSKSLRLEQFSELTVLDLSNNLLKDFPVEICRLVHLNFLNLSGNSYMKSLPDELAALTTLKYLLLRGTPCTFPNRVLSKLTALRVLDLSDYPDDNLEILPTLEEDLKCLPELQALGINICSKLVLQKLCQMVSLPVRWLDIRNYDESCLSFSNCFLTNSQLQSNIISLHIRSTNDVRCVEFGNANICHFVRLEHLEFFSMENMKEVIWKGLDPKDVFPRLQVLEFTVCPQLTSISWIVNLPCIRELRVGHCYRIKQLICIDELKKSGINVSQESFPFLKTMYLTILFELERISDPMIAFPALEILVIEGCEKLKKLPFTRNNFSSKLKIWGSDVWWNNVELEDDSRDLDSNTSLARG